MTTTTTPSPHLDHPGQWRWLPGYGPVSMHGPCPHACAHNVTVTLAFGPDWRHYVLAGCAVCACRAWFNHKDTATTTWLAVTG